MSDYCLEAKHLIFCFDKKVIVKSDFKARSHSLKREIDQGTVTSYSRIKYNKNGSVYKNRILECSRNTSFTVGNTGFLAFKHRGFVKLEEKANPYRIKYENNLSKSYISTVVGSAKIYRN